MFKILLSLIKKLIIAVLFIFAYNKMAFSLGVIIPLNIFTVLLVTFFGVPSVILLVLFSFLCV